MHHGLSGNAQVISGADAEIIHKPTGDSAVSESQFYQQARPVRILFRKKSRRQVIQCRVENLA
jgi:hypothetical protein